MLSLEARKVGSGTRSLAARASWTTRPRARGRPYCLVSRSRRSWSSQWRTTREGAAPRGEGARPEVTMRERARRQAERLAW